LGGNVLFKKRGETSPNICVSSRPPPPPANRTFQGIFPEYNTEQFPENNTTQKSISRKKYNTENINFFSPARHPPHHW
jgi:hypothetical protein